MLWHDFADHGRRYCAELEGERAVKTGYDGQEKFIRDMVTTETKQSIRDCILASSSSSLWQGHACCSLPQSILPPLLRYA